MEKNDLELNTIIETARLLVGEWAEEMVEPFPGWLDVYLTSPEGLIPAVVGLRVKRLGYLTAITGLDHGKEKDQVEAIYHFCVGKAVINLRLRLPRDGAYVPSLYEIVPGSVPFERELREMFGIEVTAIREKDPLYLPDDWPVFVHPLRKDFDPETMMPGKKEEI